MAETEAETILGPRTVTLQCSLPSANIYDNANICNFLEICCVEDWTVHALVKYVVRTVDVTWDEVSRYLYKICISHLDIDLFLSF